MKHRAWWRPAATLALVGCLPVAGSSSESDGGASTATPQGADPPPGACTYQVSVSSSCAGQSPWQAACSDVPCDALSFGATSTSGGCQVTLLFDDVQSYAGTCSQWYGGAAPAADAGAASSCTPGAAPSYAPLWHPPARVHGACSPSQLQAFLDDCGSTTATTTACDAFLAAPSNAGCMACLVTPVTAASWGPIVQDGNDLIVNGGGCLVLVDAGQTACAQGLQVLQECTQAACDPVCASSDSRYGECTSAAAAGPCASPSAAAQCAGQLPGGDATCFDPQQGLALAVGLFCG